MSSNMNWSLPCVLPAPRAYIHDPSSQVLLLVYMEAPEGGCTDLWVEEKPCSEAKRQGRAERGKRAEGPERRLWAAGSSLLATQD